MSSNLRMFLLILMVFLILGGFVSLIVGSTVTSQSGYVTYKQENKQVVRTSLEEREVSTFGSSGPPIYYLQMADGSIYFLQPDDFSPEQKPPVIHEGDTISLVYDSGKPRDIDTTKDSEQPTYGGPASPIKGVGYRIVQVTIGYDTQKKLLNENPQSLVVFSANEYREHPKDYYRNTFVSFTGGGLLVIGFVILPSAYIFWRKLARGS
ncbi:hypothetical protein [Ktedonobacter racemifer]|uniref:Uncharacterized protein n=1 Tax=Ktedonobacter racemifer DSM 44963 TaxID=485913 RepID=D6TIT9_KTERA|nr:hypothetical protein [Ktedonobacter racemifer]EFH89346.1 hypothetical protein Krac_10896 [Ktedonobacter racemifer DSM 44963]